MAGKQVLILGGGAGGLLVANMLLEKLSPNEAQITIVDRSPYHYFLAGLPWVATGYRSIDDIRSSFSVIQAKKNLRILQAEVKKIDPGNRAVETTHGKLNYDYLIVSLGAEPNYKALEGLENTLAPWTPERAVKLREALSKFTGGTIVTGFISSPYPCPPAPYEVAAQILTALSTRRTKVNVKVVVPDPKPLYSMSPSVSDVLLEALENIGVEFVGKAEYDSIDVKSKTIVTAGGDRIKYDILAVTPPYVPPKPVASSELAGSNGWMEVDPLHGFRSRKYDDVFGLGDVTAPPLNLPMAGVVAHAEAELVAAAVAGEIKGVALSYGLKLYAACAMDLGATGILPFCDFTPAITRRGPAYCGRIIEGTLAKLFKELFEVYWFTRIAPKR